MDPDTTPSMLQSMLHISDKEEHLPDFVEPPDDKYMCVYCKRTLRPPVKQTMCGHRLCGCCVPSMFSENDSPLCPGNEDECAVLMNSEIHPDVAATKEIRRMLVYCPYRSAGCIAKPKWSALCDHKDSCTYATAQCHNPGCTTLLLKSDLLRHEQFDCEYLPTLCELCDEYVPKKDLNNGHTYTCRPRPKTCIYSELGCKFEGTHTEMQQHSKDSTDTHAQYLVNTTSKTAKDNEHLKSHLDDLVTKLTDLNTHIDSFQSSSSNNKTIRELQTSIAEINDNIQRINQTINEKADQNELVQCSSKLEEIQTTSQIQESRISRLEQRPSGRAMSEEMIQKYQQMEATVSGYDTRFAEYDVRFRLLETAGYDGHLLWKITNYQRRKNDAIEGRTLSLYSQPFYSSPYGYRMCARVYLNGDGMGRGTHVSLFFVVMRGEYDALLTWPFRQKVTLAILDQSSSSRKHIKDTFRPDPTSTSFKRPVSEMNVASGSPMFATQRIIEGDSYLKDDTIFISATIEKSDLPEHFP